MVSTTLGTSKLNAAVEGTDSKERTLKPCFVSTATTVPSATTAEGSGTTLILEQHVSQRRGRPEGALAEAIDRDFGSFENFKDEFSKAAATLWLGWAWLCGQRQA